MSFDIPMQASINIPADTKEEAEAKARELFSNRNNLSLVDIYDFDDVALLKEHKGEAIKLAKEEIACLEGLNELEEDEAIEKKVIN